MSFQYFAIAKEVETSVKNRQPLVALETAVLTHGLPGKEALAAYLEMMRAVSEGGASPVPVGMVGGRVKVGLTREDLEILSGDVNAEKISMQNLPMNAATLANGGTTAAVTLWAARKAGISTLATGGIGGVHKGAGESFDVSGDLRALAQYGGVVVCSGAKSICDLPKTMETLETLGVPVIGYKTGELPAFTSAKSGIRLRSRVESVQAILPVLAARDSLGLKTAVLIVNPVPEEAALDYQVAALALAEATASAERKKITGPELTPWLLAEVERITEGKSVAANRALLNANATLAAYIAVRTVWAEQRT